MTQFLQTLVDALTVGSLYALVALGYTLVYGILKFINFAHSDVFAFGAWVSFSIAAAFGWAVWDVSKTAAAPPWWAGMVVMAGAMAVCAILGFLIERLAYKPMRSAPRLNVLITAIGVSLFLQNAGQRPQVFGERPKAMPAMIDDRVLNESVVASGSRAAATEDGVKLDEPVKLEADRTYFLETRREGAWTRATVTSKEGEYAAGTAVEATPAPEGEAPWRLVRAPLVPIRLIDVLGVGTAVLLMVLLDRLVFATKIGTAMRAVSFSERNAALMGINVNRVISTTFFIGAALAAAAGFLYAQKYAQQNIKQTADTIWVMLGLKAFVAAVVGGIGNIRGAMLGGLLIGLIEFFGAAYLSTDYRDVYVFSLLILVLLVRPGGILGKPTLEKV